MNPEEAKELLMHYFRLCAEKETWRYDSDSNAEISAIVDCILSEPRGELKRLEAHIVQLENRIDRLERTLKNGIRRTA